MDAVVAFIQPYSLVASRLSPLFIGMSMTPVARFPTTVRLMLLLIFTIAVTQLTSSQWQALPKTTWMFEMLGEFGLGVLMALGFQLMFAAIQIMGRVLDMQIGFAAAGVIDPISRNNDPLLGTMLTLFMTLLILVTNTHHQILAVIVEIFTYVPPGSWNGEFYFANIMGYFSAQLVFAFLLFGPVMMALWMLDLFNGIIAKTMPQMNVYFVMLPLKIGVGILLMSVAMQYMKPLISQILQSLIEWFRFGWVL
ncbi:flagellar biosynthetic protein FliR [Agaribacter marinus]|uniref:Flagellar biosynthetic protein FliR n=1 Tax=Agaribacter marinus TaxID=1431249 RepID=A0AA37SVC7_9ALTE|nr:flagellar biosynthetic protein FliR [Agaribacter marinus]GLR70002.1 flagellar biosynthetic protein FliR [Agaribacter marinus]